MKYFKIRIQLVYVSVILLLTLGMTLAIVIRHNRRWDFTKEKLYSLTEPTAKLLDELSANTIAVLAFYPHDDPSRIEFEIFLKECQMHHPRLSFNFYDPDRSPRLAKQYHVKDLYTVILRTENRQERVVKPTEEGFTNALLRLAQPRTSELCFVTGHEEAGLSHEDRNGLRYFRQALENSNYSMHEIILARDKIPATCSVLVMAGPHQDYDQGEFALLKAAFYEGRGLFFLLDPMDPGAGAPFLFFLKEFGVVLGEDVIVDKMSRMVGGDFLVPLVSQYVTQHPVTATFKFATFFPVARSVQPSTEDKKEIEVVPLAFSGSGSWAETNLVALEKGEAAFETESDLIGPIVVAVAVEEKRESNPTAGGRMVVVGDSDFLTNAYLELSGNRDLALNMVQWLAKDDRFISIHPPQPEFKPLFLDSFQRLMMFVATVIGLPLLFFSIRFRKGHYEKKSAMKSSIPVVFSLLFLVVAGSYVYLNPHEGSAPLPYLATASMRLLPLEEGDAIMWIQMQNRARNETITLKHEEKGWLLKYPALARADDRIVEGLVTGLALSLKARRLKREEDWAEYGLKDPALKVGIETKADKKRRYLDFGDASPIGDFIFARWEGEEEYFLLNGDLKRAFQISAYSLHQKQIFLTPIGEVSKVHVRTLSKEYEFERRGENWFWIKPHVARDKPLAKDRTDELLVQFQNLFVKDFLDDLKLDRRELGFSKEGVVLKLGPAGTDPEALYLGKEFDIRDGFYATRAGGGKIFLVARNNIKALFETIETMAQEAATTGRS